MELCCMIGALPEEAHAAGVDPLNEDEHHEVNNDLFEDLELEL